MAKANPVTDTPADPAITSTATVTAPVIIDTIPRAKTTPADPLEKFKTVVDGLTIYNFTEIAL